MAGKRYNTGKLRYELLPDGPIKEIVKVYTNGAHKYTVYEDANGKRIKGKDIPLEEVAEKQYKVVEDGADNWRNGMSWMETLACAERHIIACKNGEDIDPDPRMTTYHLANAAWNLITVLEFYKTRPEFDDRKHHYLRVPKIGLDIDEVICNWIGPWADLHGIDLPNSWFFDRDIVEKFNKMKEEGTLDNFYLSLPPKIDPVKDLPFEPHAYVTSRPIDTKVTEQWLDIHKFPARPVITVPLGTSKVDAIKKAGIEIFVDDRYDNFVELNKAGVVTYLWDANHNRRYDVGYKRIKSLKELMG